MTRHAFGLGTVLVLVTAAAPCRAELKPDVIERGKKATALVVIAVCWPMRLVSRRNR